jgi:hypothetical protein
VAFLPAFQVGLLIAVCVAAVRRVRWPVVAAGVIVLGASHVVGAWWLSQPGVPALLASHVAAVRAWAVAGPFVILAAMMVGAQPRSTGVS